MLVCLRWFHSSLDLSEDVDRRTWTVTFLAAVKMVSQVPILLRLTTEAGHTAFGGLSFFHLK